MDSVYQAAQALTRLYQPDKINYLVFGDTGPISMCISSPNIRGERTGARSF